MRIKDKLQARTHNAIDIPHLDTWKITMWHRGRDSLHSYNEDTQGKICVELPLLNRELMRTYSKRLKLKLKNKKAKTKTIIRHERQELPNITIGDLNKKYLLGEEEEEVKVTFFENGNGVISE